MKPISSSRQVRLNIFLLLIPRVHVRPDQLFTFMNTIARDYDPLVYYIPHISGYRYLTDTARRYPAYNTIIAVLQAMRRHNLNYIIPKFNTMSVTWSERSRKALLECQYYD